MALKVLHVEHNGEKGVAILTSDKKGPAAIDELDSMYAKQLAIEAAAKQGLPSPCVQFSDAPYPAALDLAQQPQGQDQPPQSAEQLLSGGDGTYHRRINLARKMF